MAFVRITTWAFSRASGVMAASVAARVISVFVIAPLGVPPEKRIAMKYLSPGGRKSFGKIKGAQIF